MSVNTLRKGDDDDGDGDDDDDDGDDDGDDDNNNFTCDKSLAPGVPSNCILYCGS